MVTFVDTQPSIIPITYEVDYSLFTAQNQSVNISTLLGNPGLLPAGTVLVGVMVHKVTPFNTNTVALGHGSVAAQRETIATAAEVAANDVGIVRPSAWLGALGFGSEAFTANRNIFARLGAGDVPTAGRLRMILLTCPPGTRTSL